MKTIRELFTEASEIVDSRCKHATADSKIAATVELTKLLAQQQDVISKQEADKKADDESLKYMREFREKQLAEKAAREDRMKEEAITARLGVYDLQQENASLKEKLAEKNGKEIASQCATEGKDNVLAS